MQCSWCSAEQEAMDFLFQGGELNLTSDELDIWETDKTSLDYL